MPVFGERLGRLVIAAVVGHYVVARFLQTDADSSPIPLVPPVINATLPIYNSSKIWMFNLIKLCFYRHMRFCIGLTGRQAVGTLVTQRDFKLPALAVKLMYRQPQRRGAWSSMSGTRVIKKYPNRRLYDTEQSRYITLSDIRKLVMRGSDFQVVDSNSSEDLTRSILLQIMLEEESGGQPLFSAKCLPRSFVSMAEQCRHVRPLS